jgi:hypothetical protein
MNLTRLKTYAPAARAAIITAVTRRAAVLGIQSGRVEEVSESGDVALIGGQPFPRSIVPLRKQLLDLIRRDGFDHTMEAMAYTWFNRLVALRFMELHDGYLDHGYRVLSHPQGTPLPEILQHAEHVSLKGLDREEVIRLKLDGNRDEELYRLLLLGQCAELNRILPDVFSRLDDATILLLPDNLLHSDSVIRQLVAGSDAEDWQQVEVLGWLYQFYISEKKDAVMARKSAVPTQDIPAVTQLFTPHWIVRYLVENSLGRLWLLNRPNSRLREHMPYYIEGDAETEFLKISKPEDIRLLDPAVGSGHMLTYAFDLLTLIYEEEGYAPTEIPALILRHNLHGLEICPRAAQLAELALVFKAREKSRRFFQPEHLVRPRIIELRDVRFAENELRDYIHALGLGDVFNQPMLRLLHQFEEAKNFGSLIQPCLDERAIANARRALTDLYSLTPDPLSGQLFLRETHLKVLRVLEQAEALTQRYHVVVANPPYLGGRGMNKNLAVWLKDNYADVKSDLFSAFVVRCASLGLPNGRIGVMSPNVWMFISSHEKLRAYILDQKRLTNLVELPLSGFKGATVQICAYNFANTRKHDSKSAFIRLVDFKGDDEEMAARTREAVANPACGWMHRIAVANFNKIPGRPFAYWITGKMRAAFDHGVLLRDISIPRQGLATMDNARFTREWHEVSTNAFSAFTKSPNVKWFPYNKGGDFRKWYGNLETVVNWQNSGSEIKKLAKDRYGSASKRVVNEDSYFLQSITWSKIGTGRPSFRLQPKGAIFDVAGMSIFPDAKDVDLLLALLNTRISLELLEVLSPTLNFEAGQIGAIPVIKPGVDPRNVCEAAIEVARADWDNFETSWDFRDQPLLRPGLKGATLEASWRNWEAQSTAAIRRMQELETENNRLFIAAYGLDGELQPEVPEAQITLARAEARRDMAAFLSYAVGCMMGRYSPDHPGLILANAGDTLREFLEKVGKPLAELTFAPDEDGIIPVLDGEWFEDDIVARTKEFLRSTFGEATLVGNIAFIEASLGKDLRTYFLNDFYKDHLQTYKNRPIYWQLSSGKQKAFQCLVYLHRYTPATLARIRTEYAIPLQGKLSARITRLEEEVTQATSSTTRKKLQTELDKSKKQIVELLAFDEQLRSYADQAITLDLDDGVKANYAKLGPLVAEAKKICGTKDD